MILVGDIGGTKTNLALFSGDQLTPLLMQSYKSGAFSTLTDIVQEFLQGKKEKIKAACFAIAGPVERGVCHATNLPWIVDRRELSTSLGISHVYLINDLEANAWATPILSSKQLLTLYQGKGESDANRAVISPGTGLGEAGLFWNGKNHLPFPSEGGHCEFGPRGELQIEVCRYLHQKFGHASYERILSGPGIVNLYNFYREHLGQKGEELSAAMITEKAMAKEPLCHEVMKLFLSILGAESSNCVLKFMALGGLYIGGGIAPKILPLLQGGEDFLAGFFDKGRFKALLEKVTISVILDDKAAILGAAHFVSTREELR